MRLYLINPGNALVSLAQPSRWTRYRVWKPLGLMVVAALTPPPWQITIFDENLRTPDYTNLPRPDLVGLTAFTAQAPRAYQLAARFRDRGVPVVMGGIHASMCPEEALAAVDAVVTGEAEAIWPTVLADARRGTLQRRYEGGQADLALTPPARHDLLPRDYAFGAIQTTRGCPLSCSFCSVSAFNGRRYRHRPVATVIDEFRAIPEQLVLLVDDNLIGTRPEHLTRAKDLFRAMIAADLGKRWICQATINFADDQELLDLARRAGCRGVLIGFESLTTEGLTEVGKHLKPTAGDRRSAVARIHRHGISVVGSFVLGLDSDTPGVGRRIAAAARAYGIDLLNLLYLTPLPGTRLWDTMAAQGRIAAGQFPADWRYYTLTFPVARHQHLSWSQLAAEMDDCWRRFYAPGQIARRMVDSLGHWRNPLTVLVANLSYRQNYRTDRQGLRQLDLEREPAWDGQMAAAARAPQRSRAVRRVDALAAHLAEVSAAPGNPMEAQT